MFRRKKRPGHDELGLDSETAKLLSLVEFVGQDLLLHTRMKAMKTMEPQTLEIDGLILGGKFRLTVCFEGEVAH